MTNVPYIYVPLLALFCYIFILTAMLAAKKNAEINAFILFILVFITWTGGSLFMRMQLAPGIYFWYDVSLLSLFSLALLMYFFVRTYARVKGFIQPVIWTVGTVIILILTELEVFLKRPVMTTLEDGRTIFVYDMGWQVFIPTLFMACIVVSITKILIRMLREKATNTMGVKAIIVGCIFILVGNVASIIPGNIFPFDTLSGIFNAIFLMYALYKKRVFKLTLLVSKNVLLYISTVGVCLICSYFIKSLNTAVAELFPQLGDSSVIAVAVIFMAMIGVVYTVMRKIFDAIFYKEEQQQAHALERFGIDVAQTLSSKEIMQRMISLITDNLQIDQVYVCIRGKNGFVSQCSANPLANASFSITDDNPCVEYIRKEDIGVIISEFKNTSLYRSMWESEKKLLADLGIACVVGLKDEDEVVGLVLLTAKPKKSAYNYNDMLFLSTVSSLASMSIKNSALYERVYHESRVDSLTGLYNYKSFCEQIEEQFKKCRDDSLGLMFTDVDDFKLYNQLYGAKEGDECLKAITDIITYCVGTRGVVFRYGGKVFTSIFPNLDAMSVKGIAEEIHNRVQAINDTPERKLLKKLTVSSGICVYPYAASNVNELINNADVAVYNAKNKGKNSTVVYSIDSPKQEKLGDGMSFLENRFSESNDSSIYAAYASTIYALTAAIDAKDHYTFNHSQNVAKYSAILATAIGMNKEHVRIIYEAALLHDIGKISIPESILCKQGALDKNEFEVMKTHVNNSIEMIRHLPSMDYVIPAAIGHHERWDGKGYPRGIAGDDIPLSARCLAIADAFDAMTSNRTYRQALSVEFASDQILKCAGTQFDPELAKIFVELVRKKNIIVEPSEKRV